MNQNLISKGENAKQAARILSTLSTDIKNKALLAIADGLVANSDYIIEKNKLDLDAAKERGMATAMMDRLALNRNRIKDISEGIRQIVALTDPIGEVLGMVKRPNGLVVGKTRVPLGVIGIIYESRPNVTADAAALCIKAGNAVILRGGSEAINSNLAIAEIMCREGEKAGLPKGSVALIEDTSRETAVELMKLNKYVDVLIPRGGAGLIQSVVKNATVPVIETGTGNCHLYIEKSADFSMAKNIAINAKTSRPSVCNAIETLLVDEEIAEKFLPDILTDLAGMGVEIRGCEKTVKIYPNAKIADESDWETEYIDYILAVKVVGDIDNALDHIAKYSTKHSDAIVTSDYSASQRFLAEVDSAAVYVNASTRFTDGFEFGFGAEIGISTQKMHARGPMGLSDLTTVKYIIYGSGQIR